MTKEGACDQRERNENQPRSVNCDDAIVSDSFVTLWAAAVWRLARKSRG